MPLAERFSEPYRRIYLEAGFQALDRVAPTLKAEADPDSWPNWQRALLEILEAVAPIEEALTRLLARIKATKLLLVMALIWRRLWLRELRRRAMRRRLGNPFLERHQLATGGVFDEARPRGPPPLIDSLTICPRAP